MTKFLKDRDWGLGVGDWGSPNLQSLISILLTIFLLTLYLSTLARTPVLGDPTEFTFIANILGIAHPPGYVFITLMGKLFQTLIPFGSLAWRMHVLSAVSATTAVLFLFGTVRQIADLTGFKNLSGLIGLVTGLTVGTAVNIWQHAIHTNPHIITATFLSANVYFLTRWWREEQHESETNPQLPITNYQSSSPLHPFAPSQKWLYAFCFSAGLGITHHPLTVMAFPGYALFIVWIRPSILRDWRTLLKMVGIALLGLLPWLYYPLRSPSAPFGPTSMNTLSGFLDHVLARGLSDSLPYFPLAEQSNRALVFWSILRLQYALPIILLAIFGLLAPLSKWATRRRRNSHPFTSSPLHLLAPALLALATFLPTYAFVISLRQQDIMAYLLGPILLVGLLAGIGLLALIEKVMGWGDSATRRMGNTTGGRLGDSPPRSSLLAPSHLFTRSPRLLLTLSLLALFFLFGPARNLWRNLPHISLREYSEGEDYVNAIEARFAGTNEGATLLNDWERMTPLWFERYVNESTPDSADVRLEYIAAGSNPWLEGIFNYLGGGPVYLSNFRQGELAGTEFRLRPDGVFYQVVEPGEASVPDYLEPVTAVAQQIELLGYHLPEQQVTAGDFVPLTLAMRAPAGTADFYIPVLTVGDITYEFTTDSHLITPKWQPGEVIIERFDFALPFDLPTGRYPLTVNIKNLSQNEVIPVSVGLGELEVVATERTVQTDHLLANFRQRVGLVKATVWDNGRRHPAPWQESIIVQKGDVLNVILTWESLAIPEESYTVFVHLIDSNNRPYIALDYTPLGGSTPTHLWIPKWLPSQRFTDPYRMEIPEELPPGTYFIEVGLYEFVGQRRLHMADQAGNLIGDRYILGQVDVE